MSKSIRSSFLCAVLLLLFLDSGHAAFCQAQPKNSPDRGAPTDGNSAMAPSVLADIGAADPKQVVRQLFNRLRSGNLEPIEGWFEPNLYMRMIGNLDLLQGAATSLTDPQRITIRRSNRDERESVYEVEVEHSFPRLPDNAQIVGINEKSYWLIGYNAVNRLIDTVSFRGQSTPIDQAGPAAYQIDDPAQPSMRQALEILAAPQFPNQNSIKFLFATTRKYAGGSFSYDTADMTFGGVDVHVPDDHRMGQIELPGTKGCMRSRW